MNMKVRLIHDTKNDRYWYEEQIGKEWVKIPHTDMACEGNATSGLEDYIKKRREERYKLYHEVVSEKEVNLDFD